MANAGHRVGTIGLIALVLVSVLLAAPTITAQNPPPVAPWMQFTIVSVDPPMIDEYIALQRDVTARVRRANNAPPWRIVGRFDTFGDNYQFITITPVQALASF